VMMIGGGGRSRFCSSADHGIGITQTHGASFVLVGDDNEIEYDFGNSAFKAHPPTQSYSLNL